MFLWNGRARERAQRRKHVPRGNHRAFRDPAVVERTVGEVMDRPLPTLEVTASLAEAFVLLSGEGPTALIATREGRPAGVVTKTDLLEYLAHHPS